MLQCSMQGRNIQEPALCTIVFTNEYPAILFIGIKRKVYEAVAFILLVIGSTVSTSVQNS